MTKRTLSSAQLAHLRRIQPAAIRAAARKHMAKATCRNGHPIVDGNLYTGRGKRECLTCRREAQQRWWKKGVPPRPSEDVVRRVFQSLHDGKTLTFITTGRISHGASKEFVPGAAIIHRASLRGFMVQNPKAANLIKRLANKNRIAAIHAAHDRRITRRRASHLTNSYDDDAFVEITKATSIVPDCIREDVRSAMFVAVAEGRLHPRDAARRVREFVTAQNLADRMSVFNPWGHLSLDKPLVEEGGSVTLGDVLTRGLWE